MDLRLFYFRVTICFQPFPTRCFKLLLLLQVLTVFSFETNRRYLQPDWSNCNYLQSDWSHYNYLQSDRSHCNKQ